MVYTGCSFAVISNTTPVLEEVLEQNYIPPRSVDIIYDRHTATCHARCFKITGQLNDSNNQIKSRLVSRVMLKDGAHAPPLLCLGSMSSILPTALNPGQDL